MNNLVVKGLMSHRRRGHQRGESLIMDSYSSSMNFEVFSAFFMLA